MYQPWGRPRKRVSWSARDRTAIRPASQFWRSRLSLLTATAAQRRRQNAGARARRLSNQLSNDGHLIQQSGMDEHGRLAAQPAMLEAYENSFGTKRSQVQILSPRPQRGLGEGLARPELPARGAPSS